MQKFRENDTESRSDELVTSRLKRLHDAIIDLFIAGQPRRDAAMEEFERLERSAELSLRRTDKILSSNR